MMYDFGLGVSVEVWDTEHSREARVINSEVGD